MPVGMFSPSAKTVNLSAVPSPSVSSRTLTRSRPRPLLPGVLQALGDPDAPPVVEGHGDRVDDVGLGGDHLDGEAVGERHRPHRLRPAKAAAPAADPARAEFLPSVCRADGASSASEQSPTRSRARRSQKKQSASRRAFQQQNTRPGLSQCQTTHHYRTEIKTPESQGARLSDC